MKNLRRALLRRARATTIAAAVLLAGLVAPQSSAVGPAGSDAEVPTTTIIDVSPPDLPIPVLDILDAATSERVSDSGRDLATISAEGGYGLPVAARQAYERAARRIERTRPGCGLPWGLLAGIGRVESDHGRYGGSTLGVDGVSRPRIRGIALDGVGPVAAIPDTDRGRLDGDTVWDRAVGPMQFIPSTWASAGVDGDNDGRADPDDLDDAALAAAGYLCPASGPIGDEGGMRAALFSYNHSDYYVDLVYAFAVGYHTGVFDIPPPPVEPDPDKTPGDDETDPTAPIGPSEEPAVPGEPDPAEPGQPTSTPKPPKPTPAPTPQPTPQPTPEPTPESTPQPTPAPLVLKSGTGLWSTCGAGWCLSGYALDLGGVAQSVVQAAADFDGDGTVETNRGEFDGLTGATVTIEAERGTAVVYLIQGLGFRNADGSFA